MANIDKNQNPYNPDEESEVIPLDTFFSPEEAPAEEEEEREGGGIGDYAKDKAKEKVKEKVKEKFGKEGVEKGVEKAGKKISKEGVKQTGKEVGKQVGKQVVKEGVKEGGELIASAVGEQVVGSLAPVVGNIVAGVVTVVQTADAVTKIPLGMVKGEYKKVELPEGIFIFLICLSLDIFGYLSVITIIGIALILPLVLIVKIFLLGVLGGWFLFFRGGTKALGLIWFLIKVLFVVCLFPISGIFWIDVFRHNKMFSEFSPKIQESDKSKAKKSPTSKTSSTKGTGAKKT